jgi:hypothetical protein
LIPHQLPEKTNAVIDFARAVIAAAITKKNSIITSKKQTAKSTTKTMPIYPTVSLGEKKSCYPFIT